MINKTGISFIILFVACQVAFAQSKWDKMIGKAEASYTIGDYAKANKYLAKFNKKASKKLGKQNEYTPTYFTLLAKYKLAAGQVFDFEANVQTAVNASTSLNQEESKKHGMLLLDIAALYNQNGAYRQAVEYLDQSKSILDKIAEFDKQTEAQWNLQKAEALAGQGFYTESISIMKEYDAYFAGRALRQETYVDDNGNLKSRKLSSDEAEERFNEYAHYTTLLAKVYGEQGNLLSADSAFVGATSWIDKNLGSTSLAYIKNQLYHAKMLIANGNENSLPRELEYSRTLNSLKARHKASHYVGVELYEEYLKQLLGGNSSARYLNTKLEFEKMINSNFEKGSIYSARLKAVDFDSKKSKDKTRNLESDAMNMLSNSAGLPRNNVTTIRITEFLYDLAIEQKKYKNAETYLNSIIDIKKELYGGNAPLTHLARIHLANFFVDNTNNLAEAAAIYKESFENSVEKEIGAWHIDHLDILNHVATLYELTDKYQEATAALDKASDVARSKYDDQDYQYGAELNQIAKLQIKLGSYEKAEENLNNSLIILENYRKEDDKKEYLINAIETQATLFGIKGMFDEAQDALDRSAKMISKSDIAGIDELSTAKELSSLFIQLGKYSVTKKLLTDLIGEYEKLYGANSLRLIDPLVNMGSLTLAEGNYTDAEKVALRVNGVARDVYGEKSTKTAPTQKLLSDIYYTIGDYEKAETYIQRALESQEKQFGRSHVEVAKSISQLALIKFYKGDKPATVEKLLLEARDIMGAKLGKENPQYADILKNVAILNISQNKYDIAFSSLTQAENIWRTKTGSKNNINAASIYSLTGDVYYQIKNYDKAEDFYNQSKAIYDRSFSKSHPEYVKVLSKLAKVYYMEKDYKRAKRNIEEALTNYEDFLKRYFPALSEREKAKYWNTIKPDFEFYNTLAFGQLDDFRDLSGKVYNYQLLTKALLLSSSIKMKERILNSDDEDLKASYNNWVMKKELLTNALSMSTQQLAENEIDPTSLSNEVEKLEKQLSEKSELFSQDFENKRITYENVQKSLGKNDVAIEMVRYRYFDHVFTDSVIYVALYLRNDNNRPKAVELPEGHRMETRFFKYYRNCITGKIADQYSYGVFWEPVQNQIGQYATLFLSPDGVYNQLNLEAIPTPDGKYVIDNSNIVIVSNTKDLYLRKIKSRSEGSSNTATMFGNPTFYITASSGNIPSLPGTEKEVAQLQVLLNNQGWKTSEYTEVSASEEQLKEVDSPKIFHIATHGFYTPDNTADNSITENEAERTENPLLKTGLLLKGAGDLLDKTKYNYNIESGILTAYEAMNLNLDKTDLVVLSACETGLGEISNGEGVYGLQRAFLVAGAKTLIMSMFKVDDEATQKLILNFYRKWLSTGNLRQSFTEAKKELRTDYPDPIYWGAFMMIGLDSVPQ
ncbi:MAG: CHAT domain-containing tetratricopeptide repeat protein [Cyclobacteriaceae bacterium]